MRRLFFILGAGFWAAIAPQAAAIESGTEVPRQAANLKPGDYVWHPATSPNGPVVIVVHLGRQMMEVYRNGQLIGRSTVSSGMKDHPTPTGIFTILQKRVTHHSNVYHEASMPYMERLTWGGLAIHAGNLPGYPESHGCVHVPMDFAKKLYQVTDKGATVLITDQAAAPPAPAQPDLVFYKKGSPLPLPPPGTPDVAWKPSAAPSGPVCVVFSSADRRIYVYRNGVEIGRVTITGTPAGPPLGDRVYTASAQTRPDGSHEWRLLGSLDASPAPDAADLLSQLGIPPDFLAHMREVITPGATLVLTDQPVNKPAHSASSHDILDTQNN